MLKTLQACLGSTLTTVKTGRCWRRRTLIVGPFEPVDGDSVACTKALIVYLRRHGLEAYTLPTLSMHLQIEWILERCDFHPCESFPEHATRFVTDNLQSSYDKLLKHWRPDEIVLVDGLPDRLGFDPHDVSIYSIDHHNHQARRNNNHALIRNAPSAGCVLIEQLNILEPILAVSILTDTFWLRYNQPSSALKSLARLTTHGLTDALLAEYQRKLMVKKDTHILEVLRSCDLRLFQDGEAVFVVLKDSDPEIHRAVVGQLGYFCSHICVVRGDGYVSLRTADLNIDLSKFAIRFGGGGHRHMAGMKLPVVSPQTIEEVYKAFVNLLSKTQAAHILPS